MAQVLSSLTKVFYNNPQYQNMSGKCLPFLEAPKGHPSKRGKILAKF